MKVYQPSNFEVARKMHYGIITDFGTFVWLPTYIFCYFFNIKIINSEYTETILWFWMVALLIMLFIAFKKFDIRRAFVIEADERGVRLQYYSGHFFFTEKLNDVKLEWQNVEKIENWHRWTASAIPPIRNTLFIHTKDRERYTIDIDLCSTLMKKIDKELNEMLKQYGGQKEEQ